MKKISELMRRQVFSVGPDDSVDRVFFLLHYEKIRHLPVVEEGKIIGIVSDRDLYKALGPRSRRRGAKASKDSTVLYVTPKKVRHIMRRGVVTVSPDAALSEAASLMAGKKIGALPVAQKGKLVGIVTSTDLLHTFANMARSLERMMGAG